MKIRTMAVLASSLLLAQWAHAQDISTLYQAYQDKGRSTLSMDELNKPVRFDAVALGVSSSLNGTPVLAAGNDDGYELARLIGADQAQVALMQGMRTGQKIAAECVLQFTSGSDFLAFNQCTFN